MKDPTIDAPILSAQQVLGWGVLYLILIAGADIPATGKIAAAFSWLLFLSIMLFYGVDAFNNLSNLDGGVTTYTNPDGSGGININD